MNFDFFQKTEPHHDTVKAMKKFETFDFFATVSHGNQQPKAKPEINKKNFDLLNL